MMDELEQLITDTARRRFIGTYLQEKRAAKDIAQAVREWMEKKGYKKEITISSMTCKCGLLKSVCPSCRTGG